VTEILQDLWYPLVLKLLLDKNNMLLRYQPLHKNGQIDVDLAFDAGAYTGTSFKRLRTLGYKNIVCLEASPQTFSRLYRKQHTDPNVSFINRAVSDVSGRMIPFYENPANPTLNTTNEAWLAIPRHAEFVRKVKKCEVKTITLDEVIELLGVIPGYMKIDVEGHEISVLRGLHHKPNLLSFEWVAERMDSNIEVLGRVHEIGFTKFTPIRGEGLPSYAPGTEKSFEEILELWKQPESLTPGGGNVWCR
jgi:FkbM family methyltransferase